MKYGTYDTHPNVGNFPWEFLKLEYFYTDLKDEKRVESIPKTTTFWKKKLKK